MDQLYVEKLLQRDCLESRFSELFTEVSLPLNNNIHIKDTDEDTVKVTAKGLRKELKAKDEEIKHLKEVIEIKDKDKEKLSNELISLNIEINLMGAKYAQLEEEHEKLVKRWLERVHQEFDILNSK